MRVMEKVVRVMQMVGIMVTGESDERDGKGFDRDGTTRLKKKAAPYFEWKDKKNK